MTKYITSPLLFAMSWILVAGSWQLTTGSLLLVGTVADPTQRLTPARFEARGLRLKGRMFRPPTSNLQPLKVKPATSDE